MSAFLDALSGAGYDGTESGGIGSVGLMSATDSNGGGYFSGLLQSVTSLGTGYLANRLDIDLAHRVQGAMAQPQLRTTQNGVGGYGQIITGPNGQQVAALNLSALLPLALVGVAVYFIAKRF